MSGLRVIGLIQALLSARGLGTLGSLAVRLVCRQGKSGVQLPCFQVLRPVAIEIMHAGFAVPTRTHTPAVHIDGIALHFSVQ